MEKSRHELRRCASQERDETFLPKFVSTLSYILRVFFEFLRHRQAWKLQEAMLN